jgi:hypothetical protein
MELLILKDSSMKNKAHQHTSELMSRCNKTKVNYHAIRDEGTCGQLGDP